MTASSSRDRENMIPCPGCGGRGKFEWANTPKVPKTWTPAAVCAMCRGAGQIPAAWMAGSRTGR